MLHLHSSQFSVSLSTPPTTAGSRSDRTSEELGPAGTGSTTTTRVSIDVCAYDARLPVIARTARREDLFLVRSGDFIYVLSVLAPTYDAALVDSERWPGCGSMFPRTLNTAILFCNFTNRFGPNTGSNPDAEAVAPGSKPTTVVLRF